MNYQETVEYLFTSTPVFEKIGAKAYKPGLDTMYKMDEHFGHPHNQYKCIHIAGTNGKGSSSHTLAAILQSQGYKVGLFTSPHLVDFRERIRVNGEMVSEEYVIDFVENNRKFFEPLHPSFFELTTMMAFQYFAEQKVDFAVIEVGLGGRLDSTNIITPIQPVFIKKAHEQNSPIHFAHATDADMNFELKGNYQKKNFCTISTAVECLKEEGIEIKDESIKNGFEHVCELTGLRGRWEKLNEHPLTICDTGHNLAGWEYLEPQIASVTADTKHIVFGMVDDKDVEHVMGLLEKLPKESTIFYWTQPSTKRAIPVDKLYGYAQKHGLNGTCYQTIAQAFNKAKANAKKDDFIFIGGSSYVVADLLSESF